MQAKAINDRGDVVGFADGKQGAGRSTRSCGSGGSERGAVDLGVPRGYVASEAYGINDDRVVFGLLYDKSERTFPFRWKNGRMSVLKGPNGRRARARRPGPQRDQRARRDRRDAAGRGRPARRALDARRQGDVPARAARPRLDVGLEHQRGRRRVRVVAQAAQRGRREQPRDLDAVRQGRRAEDRAGPCRRGRRGDHRSGLTVGYLGNLGTEQEPESDQAAVWQTATSAPQLLGPARPRTPIAELVDVNDRGQAVGGTGRFAANGFTAARAAIWQAGGSALRRLRMPAAARGLPVIVSAPNDINTRGAIVGNVYGLPRKDYGKLRRMHAVLWRCQFRG